VSDGRAGKPAAEPASASQQQPSSGGGARRPRRQRSITESLLSIVLGLEAILVFFVALTVFGLHALPPLQAFVGGAVLALLLLLGTYLVRYPAGVWYGWVLQAMLVATGILLPALYIAAAFFLALWIFCFVRARQLSHQQLTDPTEGEQQK
jgi:hypothetical protein